MFKGRQKTLTSKDPPWPVSGLTTAQNPQLRFIAPWRCWPYRSQSSTKVNFFSDYAPTVWAKLFWVNCFRIMVIDTGFLPKQNLLHIYRLLDQSCCFVVHKISPFSQKIYPPWPGIFDWLILVRQNSSSVHMAFSFHYTRLFSFYRNYSELKTAVSLRRGEYECLKWY